MTSNALVQYPRFAALLQSITPSTSDFFAMACVFIESPLIFNAAVPSLPSQLVGDSSIHDFLAQAESANFEACENLAPAFWEEFLSLSQAICTLEALPFQTGEAKEELISHYAAWKTCTETIAKSLDMPLTDAATQRLRLAAGIALTFREWMNEVEFFKETLDQKVFLLQESPLLTLRNLLARGIK
jgi:hypothetical protein